MKTSIEEYLEEVGKSYDEGCSKKKSKKIKIKKKKKAINESSDWKIQLQDQEMEDILSYLESAIVIPAVDVSGDLSYLRDKSFDTLLWLSSKLLHMQSECKELANNQRSK